MTFMRGYMGGRNRSNWKWRFSCMEDVAIWLVLDGRGEFHINDQTIPLGRGVCVIIPPGTAGWAEQNKEAPLWTIAVHFIYSGTKSVELPLYCAVDDVSFLHRLMENSIRSAWTRDNEGADYWLGGIVAEIRHRSKFELNKHSHHEEIESWCRKIAFAPEKEWNVGKMAQRTSLCREHFSRLFFKEKGMSPQEFIIRSRLERATQLLHHSDCSISEVASACGYQSVYFFSRQFKQRFGISPSSIRKS